MNELRAQIQELPVQIHELRDQFHKLPIQIHENNSRESLNQWKLN